MKITKPNLNLLDYFIFLLLILISFLLSSTSFLEGYDKAGNLLILGANLHDAYWHIALQESLKHSIPPENPIYSGQNLSGYHYLTDLLFSTISSLVHISSVNFYLKVAPPFLALFFVFSTFKLSLLIAKEKIIALLLVTIVCLGSGFAYLAPFLYKGASSGQSIFWLEQPIRFLTNQQLILSLSLVNLILILITISIKKWWIWVAFLIGILAGVKVYAFIVLFPALGLLALFKLFKSRKEWHLSVAMAIGLVIAVGLISITGLGNNASPFFLKPGWFVQTIFESPDRLNFSTWEIHRQLFESTHNYLRLSWHWFFAFIIFLFGNFGLKILALLVIPIIWKKRLIDRELLLVLLFVIFISILFPLFFLQKGIVWNTIQFMHYGQVPLTILIVIGLRDIFKKRTILAMLILLAVCLPTTIKTIMDNFNRDSYTLIPNQRILAVEEIKKLPKDKRVILGYDFNQDSFVPAFGARSVFYADQTILDILNINAKEREKYAENIELSVTKCNAGDYLLFGPSRVGMATSSAELIFSNKEMVLVKCF